MSKYRQIKRHLERKAAAELEAKREIEREKESQRLEQKRLERLESLTEEEKKKEDSLIKGFKGRHGNLLLTSAILASLGPIESRIK